MSDKDIAGLTDEEFLNEFAEHEAKVRSAPEPKASNPGVQGEAQPSGATGEGEPEPEKTGGADPGEQASDPAAAGEGTSSEEGEEVGGNGEPSADTGQARAESHQDPATSEAEPADASDPTAASEPGDELAQLMAPLKAAKRTIKLESVEQARSLMQMGIDYSRKMQDMKPYQRVLKTLERADLLDEGKLNFLIDLSKKDPAAIKKLLKDSDVDPLDLDLEDSGSYKPNDHMVPERELALDEALDAIRPSPSFNKTVDILQAWDTASKKQLMDNPEVIGHLNAHVEAGLYEMIMDQLESDKIFGKHAGLSDLDAYKAVGDAMFKAGAFNKANPQGAPSNAGTTGQGPSQDSQGSRDALNARRRAASPPKGTAGKAPPKVPDFARMTDDEIEKFDWRTAL